MNPSKYVKAIFGAVSALAGAYAVAVKDGVVDSADWTTVALAAVVGFVTVWAATNETEPKLVDSVQPAGIGE